MTDENDYLQSMDGVSVAVRLRSQASLYGFFDVFFARHDKDGAKSSPASQEASINFHCTARHHGSPGADFNKGIYCVDVFVTRIASKRVMNWSCD